MTRHRSITTSGDTTGKNGVRRFLSVMVACMLLAGPAIVISGCGSSSESGETAAAKTVVYERFTLQNIYNKRYQWSDFLGKPFIINIWATWCGPCRREMPILKKLYEEYHPKGLEIVGISFDDARTRQMVVPFVEQFEIPWVILYGEQRLVQEFSLGTSIPTTLFFDAGGKETARIVGAQPEAAFRRELARLFPESAGQ